jgi:HEAT repeat protein
MNPAVRQAAAEALHTPPEDMVEPFIRVLGDEDREVRIAAAAALGRAGSPALGHLLEALSSTCHEAGALMALDHFQVADVAPAIRQYASDRVSRAVYYYGLSRGVHINGNERARLLAEALYNKAEQTALNVLHAVSLLSDRQSIELAIGNLQSHDQTQRAYALETLETHPENHLIRPLFALWEGAEVKSPGWGTPALQVLQDEDAWLRACGVFASEGWEDPQARSILTQLVQFDPDALVRDAAGAVLKEGESVNTLRTLSMMETILFLRHVPLFADLSPADLKQVAAIASESLFPDGETIARQGDPGDEMYIIVSGEVSVISATGMEFVRRKPGEYVGEMAIISREPRSASMVAVGDVRTLGINQKQFEGILRERPETSLAVMRVLCARLRELSPR